MPQSFVVLGHEGFAAMASARLADAGYARASEVASADIVLTFCTSQSDLEERYFGDAGIVSDAAPSTLLIDMSATTPSFAREIYAVAAVSDLAMVEAPLVVADVAAREAFARENLSCFLSGEDDPVARATPVLEALVGVVHAVGGPGEAQLARAAYTLQIAAQVIAVIEADALYHAHRRSALGGGIAAVHPGAASPQAASVLEAVEQARFDGAYTVEMLMSEVSAAIMAADDVELIIPQAESAMHLLELLAIIGGSDKSPVALALAYGEEEDCARNGLDWTRAEQAYGQGADHDHDHGDNDEDLDGFDDFDFDDPYGAGFDYSSN